MKCLVIWEICALNNYVNRKIADQATEVVESSASLMKAWNLAQRG